MKKSRILALLLAIMMCFTLAACGGTTDPVDPEGDDPNVGDEVGGETGDAEALRIGFIGPLTGPAALYGINASQGAQIAVDEINEGGGSLRIDFRAVDDEHDAERGVNAYNNLTSWGAQAIVGTVTTTPCLAVAPHANAERVFMLTPSASSDEVTALGDNLFQICFSDSSQGIESAQYIYNNNLGSKIAVIYNNSDAYSTGIYQSFDVEAANIGLEIVSVTTFTEDNQTDFSVQLQSAQDAGADLIFIPTYYTPASNIMRQAADMEYDVSYFGCDGLDGILGLDNFDLSLAEGLMLLTPFNANKTDDKTVSFVEKYEARYGETPSQFAADGYDCIYAIYNASLQSGEDVTALSAAEMCELMIATFSSEAFVFNGLTGSNMTWRASGEVSKTPLVVVIEDGKYVDM